MARRSRPEDREAPAREAAEAFLCDICAELKRLRCTHREPEPFDLEEPPRADPG